MSIFPELVPDAAAQEESLPVPTELAWDFKNNCPLLVGGVPQTVTGKAAVAVWANLALQTERMRYPGFSADYGSDLMQLAGTSWVKESKEGNARRMIRDCLLVSPYITEVSDLDTSFDGRTLTGSCTINTIYGDEVISFES